MSYLTIPLDSTMNREDFSCGKEILDNYLCRQANKDIKRKLAVCFVMPDKESNLIQGYYTLSSNSIPLDMVPDEFRKKLPKSYKSIPTILLGRLAVEIQYQGTGTGKLLLVDALKRCFESSSSIGSFAFIVDPLDNDAEKFYEKYGFIKLPDSSKMFLPMQTIKRLFE
jgi:hypothetical protein